MSLLLIRSRRIHDRFCGNIEVADHFPLRMIEMLDRIANSQRLRVGIIQRVLNDIEPIAVTQLRRFIPLICRQTDRVSACSTFDFDPPDAGNWVAIAGL